MRMLRSLLFALALTGSVAGQARPADSTVVVEEGVSYAVTMGDSLISAHGYLHTAIRAATAYARRNGLLAGVAIDLSWWVPVMHREPDTKPDEEPEEPDFEPDPRAEPEPRPDRLPTPDDATVVVAPRPSDVWISQEWDYPAGSVWNTWGDPLIEGGGDAGGLGLSSPVVLPTPGPWGGNRALENRYGTIPASAQPQVGTYWHLPEPVRELWVQTWVRFGPEWEIGPGNPSYAGGNVDHKVMFLIDAPAGERWGARWEWKVGVNWNDISVSAHDHDTFYAYAAVPAGQPYPQPNGRLRANRDAWDGDWHEVRWHAKMNDAGQANGRMRIWWDGALVADTGLRDLRTAGREFTSILFGGNRNQGTNHPMSFFFGPARLYRTNPGW